jgi:hypothetical protein
MKTPIMALAIVGCISCGGGDPFFVVNASPTENETDVPTDAFVSVTFNRAAHDVTVIIEPDGGLIGSLIFRGPDADMSVDDTFTFGLSQLVSPATEYSFIITATDSKGDGLATPYVFHFTTGQ